MKSTSGVVQIFVHLVLGVGTNQAYIAFKRHTAALSTAEHLWFGAHLCTSPIIYNAVITVGKSIVSEHSLWDARVVAAALKWKNIRELSICRLAIVVVEVILMHSVSMQVSCRHKVTC